MRRPAWKEPRIVPLTLDSPPRRTRQLTGIVEFEAGDGTLTARAGSSIAELNATIRDAGLEITPDVPRPAEVTLGGVIALKTPKFGGPAYRMHGPRWNGFRHGYHKYLFSGPTLARTLRAGGFEVLKHPRRERILDDVLILWGRKTEEAFMI